MADYQRRAEQIVQMRKEPLAGVNSPVPLIAAWLTGINTQADQMPVTLQVTALDERQSVHALSQAWDRELAARRHATGIELAIVDLLAGALRLSQISNPLRRYTDIRDPYVRGWLCRLTAGMTHVESCPEGRYPRWLSNHDFPPALRPYYESSEPGMLEINSEHALLVMNLANALAAYRQHCRPGDEAPFAVALPPTSGHVWHGSLRRAMVEYSDNLTLWISEAARIATACYATKYNAPPVSPPAPTKTKTKAKAKAAPDQKEESDGAAPPDIVASA